MGEAKRRRDAAAGQQLRLFDDDGNPTPEALPDGEGLDASGYEGIEPAPDPDATTAYVDGEPVEEVEPEKVTTAFLVLIEDDGSLTVTPDVEIDVVLRRPPTFDDIYAASYVLTGTEIDEEDTRLVGREVETGFVVRIEETGQRWASSNINTPLEIRRAPNYWDVAMAAGQIMKDITVIETSGRTVQQQLQTAAAVAEQQQNAKIVAKLQEKGIHLPPGARPGVPLGGQHRH